MEIQDIKDLMDKMVETGLNVIVIDNEGSHLRLERTAAQVVQYSPAAPVAQPAATTETPAQSAAASAVSAAEPVVEKLPGHLVVSPVVGIYYSAASPDSDPFVAVGATVEVGSPLCIIEAMKLMNEVTSTLEGTILEIMVENGQRVEFGQPLMRIGGQLTC